ncbi:hypothetical protein CONPUDRAFT_142245 [Coniophora puteana RWD-64-598 SS2]|uniref:DUF6533 domain-containing protein n=1 Tax=Coniophora puteana (strain RWD-64-598) TaxID=741705 RepID=A0A5M3MY66_CONPW|nr:uncharacterized protein CONPUDRAFT_142245 [Coniophora puteana RWD-64-598 SS2]EIW83571.1 hypothetical protein CONPUDRAFT_142245 [Coniophora puteana RWD-64-598 SS2]
MDQLDDLARGLQVTNFLDVSVCTIFVYDYFINLPDEIKYLWRRREIGWGLVLYILVRYLPFISLPLALSSQLLPALSNDTCKSLLYTVNSMFAPGGSLTDPDLEAVLESAEVIAAEVLFAFRTYIMWNRNKIVFALLSSMTAVALALVTALLVLFLPTITLVSPPVPGINGCIKSSASSIIFGAYLFIVVTELVILGLITVHACQDKYRLQGGIIETMIYSGALYCTCMLLFSVANIGTNLRLHGSYSDLLSTYQTIFHTILASRLQLHLCSQFEVTQGSHRSYNSMKFSPIVFQQGSSVVHEV